ncbi:MULTISPECIES: methylthioribulose 1-phosphate dehydratase [Bacillales]|jgi:methylthioribulose-1-phosphate dehydratase|uniref:Methylthioribulose-1-phosphate dehydratase n=1 Tax=Brevibacillus aydinogluensis TaxID=927786 RepID=A0AA48M828_9BACL|nr:MULTISPECIES: methylthioribulose 1-phosphate dehydratase [Bacillales]REK63732.1 MAG: methylthioribulose 1-phosphate dehydratase [Brevibacillus sp.]MDT3415795.1 methylthioribulose-1-phosphate dehydratase [Brevibacillus aydinogluensis]NNV03873.1 methylthioribulose 1-phosphate dehydratase [Brevibacillus sp. MCWH]UFJ61743.1 methylthioribulose 1-phosphate dehydratase [Anoxybacillus sediminis]CAJ1001360.1 methylthioribulose 1-phosphate dehydratase [Brevibacillus aydinogluensis]
MTVTLEQRADAFRRLDEAKLTFARRDWFPGTSGNLSIKLSDDPLQFAVTASGKDKTKLSPEDYLVVDGESRPVEPTTLKPSAETLIHAVVYKRIPQAGACFHVHTVWNNLVSELYFGQRAFSIQGQELIKGLGIWEENARITIPIVENFAHIPTLAAAIEKVITPDVPGVLIRNHGIYAWGANDFEAKRHLESFEFLFEYHVRWLQLRQTAVSLTHPQ